MLNYTTRLCVIIDPPQKKSCCRWLRIERMCLSVYSMWKHTLYITHHLHESIPTTVYRNLFSCSVLLSYYFTKPHIHCNLQHFLFPVFWCHPLPYWDDLYILPNQFPCNLPTIINKYLYMSNIIKFQWEALALYLLKRLFEGLFSILGGKYVM